jgi:hypothetical protein
VPRQARPRPALPFTCQAGAFSIKPRQPCGPGQASQLTVPQPPLLHAAPVRTNHPTDGAAVQEESIDPHPGAMCWLLVKRAEAPILVRPFPAEITRLGESGNVPRPIDACVVISASHRASTFIEGKTKWKEMKRNALTSRVDIRRARHLEEATRLRWLRWSHGTALQCSCIFGWAYHHRQTAAASNTSLRAITANVRAQ